MVLRFCLRVGDAFEGGQEALRFVGGDERDVVVIAEHGRDLLRLALAQETVIHEDAGEPVADRLVDQDGGDGGIDPAGEAADDAALAHLGADALDRLLAVGAHGPVEGEARDAGEVLQEAPAARGVVHLGVELHGVEAARGVGGDGVGGAGGGGVGLEPRGEAGDVVAVAHPHLLAPGGEPAFQEVERGGGRDPGAAELGRALAARDLPAERVHHELLAVANPEGWEPHLPQRIRYARGVRIEHGGGAAGQDHGLWGELGQEVGSDAGEGVDLAVNADLARAAGDELRHLAAEIDDQEAVVGGGLHGRRVTRGPVRRQWGGGGPGRRVAF